MELVVDVDPSTCSSKYFKKLTLSVSPEQLTQKARFFSFSDAEMPSNCDFTVYLQTPCKETSCRSDM